MKRQIKYFCEKNTCLQARTASMDRNELYSNFEAIKFIFNQIVTKTRVLDFLVVIDFVVVLTVY